MGAYVLKRVFGVAPRRIDFCVPANEFRHLTSARSSVERSGPRVRDMDEQNLNAPNAISRRFLPLLLLLFVGSARIPIALDGFPEPLVNIQVPAPSRLLRFRIAQGRRVLHALCRES